MKDYIKHDEWLIIEEGFNPEHNRISESLCSIGNGRMGQRANFEEYYSGDTLQGSYVAGVYYPDKTRVGWWKNGYPEYFAKVINSANWIGIDVEVEGERLDLAKCEVTDFRRVLNMKEGYLLREFKAKLASGKQIKVVSKRLTSIVDDQIGAISYSITPINFSGNIVARPSIDFDVVNEDSNYDEKFWTEVSKSVENGSGWIIAKTNKLDFSVATGMKFLLSLNGVSLNFEAQTAVKDKYLENSVSLFVSEGDTLTVEKYAAIISSENHDQSALSQVCEEALERAVSKGIETLLEEQANAWAEKWEESDIKIDGDVSAQQGIRFNIFQLNQTYTGEDERLNIGPKGFTGEKYGGSTYWDTEAYCVPFYLSTAGQHVSRNLLMYRYKHLDRAIENAGKLGFDNGAALYPMVTMNGEECHNEWEITFEEIHRNGAIAYAVFDYTRYTGDTEYLVDFGIEVLVGIARFWKQRVNFSEDKGKYVMLGVTGPNEYENNVNNNWYTNKMATWSMSYALESLQLIKKTDHNKYNTLLKKLNFNEVEETKAWNDIIENMYYPYDEKRGIFLQQDGFLDKSLIPAKNLAPEQRPINQKWSWDRILRSCYIKQADVLQGIYFFEEAYDLEEIKRNFEFYEPLTVHESSLSPCVHSILAAKLGLEEKSYEMYVRTARLDLDDYNNDTEDGCHTTSMAGTWMSIVKGFGGMTIEGDTLSFKPFIPKEWNSYSFKTRFRNCLLDINISKEKVVIENLSDTSLTIKLFDKELLLNPQKIELVLN